MDLPFEILSAIWPERGVGHEFFHKQQLICKTFFWAISKFLLCLESLNSNTIFVHSNLKFFLVFIPFMIGDQGFAYSNCMVALCVQCPDDVIYDKTRTVYPRHTTLNLPPMCGRWWPFWVLESGAVRLLHHLCSFFTDSM